MAHTSHIEIKKWLNLTKLRSSDNMSRKSMIMFGMIIGSFAGGYMPTLMGAGAFSLTSLLGSVAGGVLGIWLAYKLTR